MAEGSDAIFSAIMLGEEEEEAPKRDPAISLHDQDMEDINDVWNTFRLPIPIPQINSNNRSNNQNEWLLQVVDQLRLLQTMKEQYANPNNGTPYRSSSRHQRMKGQINFAISGQARIEQTFPSSPQMTTNDDDTKIIDDGDYTHQPIFYENAHRLVQTMRAETEDICEKFHEWLSRHPEQLQMQENVIANIFFAPLEPVATQDKPLDELSVEGDGDGDEFDDDDEDLKQQVPTQKRSQSTTRKLIPTNQQQNQRSEDIDPVEFQKQQQELLEEELSSMATRLKSSTLAMNATLQTQTKDLDGMEDITQANLDTVSSTTRKVEQRLTKKKGWKKRLSTWSMIFTVIGMWVLCFMIMRTIPKRKVGKVRVVWKGKRWYSCKNFITEKTGQLKDRLDILLNGKSFDSHWEQSKASHENERQRHKQQQQQRKQHKQRVVRQECEILPDGSQVCRDRESHDNPDAKAQHLVAERKQRRVDENMANARMVDAMEPADIEAEADENMECIPNSPAMQKLQKSLEGMTNARSHLTESFDSSPFGSEKRQSFLKNLKTLQLDFQRFVTALEGAQNTARTEFWAGKEQEAMQEDMSFCTLDKSELEQNQVALTALSELIKAEEDRLRIAQEKEAKLRKESQDAILQRTKELRRKKIQIEARKAREAAKELEAEGFRASDVRFAAGKGQNDLLAYYISEMPIWIDASDTGGWRPLHEAAKAGNSVCVELLISAGCDISSRTGRSGNGGTALWWAIQRYGESHDVVALLRFHNALEAGPEKKEL